MLNTYGIFFIQKQINGIFYVRYFVLFFSLHLSDYLIDDMKCIQIQTVFFFYPKADKCHFLSWVFLIVFPPLYLINKMKCIQVFKVEWILYDMKNVINRLQNKKVARRVVLFSCYHGTMHFGMEEKNQWKFAAGETRRSVFIRGMALRVNWCVFTQKIKRSEMLFSPLRCLFSFYLHDLALGLNS